MIFRSLTRAPARQALAAAIASPASRVCTRFISQDTSTTGLTPEAFEKVTAAAAMDQIAQAPTTGQKTRSRKARKEEPKADVRDSYHNHRRLQKMTASIGSHVDNRYSPKEMISHPIGPDEVTLELLMASQAHMGHHTSRWNPANARYIYGVRQDIHIIALETTASHLRRAARVVEEVAYRGGLILFVGNRPGQMNIVTKAASLSKACHMFTKWTPGAITNRDVILRDKRQKMVDKHDRDLENFDDHVLDKRPLIPDLVVCLNPLENYTMLYECGLASIPTVGIIDTDADPTWVTYPIPANDDSLRAVGLIGGVLGRAGETGQQRRLEEAEDGVAQWQTPTDTKRFMDIKRNRWHDEMEQWQADAAAEVEKRQQETKRVQKQEKMAEEQPNAVQKEGSESEEARRSIVDI